MTKTISKHANFVVVEGGLVVSGHIRGDVAQAAAKKVGGYAAATPTVPRGFASIKLTIGQRVRIDNGAAIPI